ncbi:hypothetical protein [Paenibacillus sp. MBLB4367]|uniref:hypothetical protein n=1 Tax=Paenibacillus sp. MBLB4367 TaxID=3384767 RepID=UPI0039083D54
MENNPLLTKVLPSLAHRIKEFFISNSRLELAIQVDDLRIKEMCECGEPDCGSFYLTQYIDNEKKLEGFAFEGIGTIEVCEGKISFIEIFSSKIGNEIHTKLRAILLS